MKVLFIRVRNIGQTKGRFVVPCFKLSCLSLIAFRCSSEFGKRNKQMFAAKNVASVAIDSHITP